MEVPVYYLFHGDFPGVEFFTSRGYIHVVEGVPEDFLFDHTESQTCGRACMHSIRGTEAENRFDGSDEEGNFPVLTTRQITNPMEEDMAILCFSGIAIDDDNDTAPENVPEQQNQQKGNREEGGKVYKSEGIIFPHKAKNLQNSFACFQNYTK